ncbi:hypothetical protein PC116_g28776 [Phytophthora cactorum]|uniref:Uncharacterized protein n=1 Tax=Phytophthora cactorum TaxID=29920 RepID=A0A8T1AGQ1_9STRA|nr:hypothetical protein PC117_g26807 [Phytophthora cactorum]KAG2953301.1 hypothetical protein PC119_g28073 [Phytophthora cactorum]KAG3123129.1 hypothetical protein C6341_g26677 [Phytophthora cactorum]KAG3131586.1 hypothetical protein PC128_g26587 [Phytophthora cactorum]KAG4222751.1 hypothetical protein PC116_g28776 [Phytophthora cactorum]
MTSFSASLTMTDLSVSSRGLWGFSDGLSSYALAVRLAGVIAVDVMYPLPSL